MKNLLVITIVLFTVLVSFQACSVFKITDKEEQAIIEKYLKTKNSSCNPCEDYSGQTFHKLEVNMLKEMAGGYSGKLKSANYPLTPVPKDDATNIWFSLESLKRFIWEIESNACGKNCTDNIPRLGVRIYYARYPVTGSVLGNSSRYNDLLTVDDKFTYNQTVFMVPTYDSNGTSVRHIDFDPSSTFDKTNCKYPIIETEGTGTNSIVALGVNFPVTNPTQTSAKNHGDLCPPICNASDAAFGKY